MDISIVIVNMNTKGDLRNCLLSVFKSLEKSELDFEIFIVDNNSSDGSQEMVRKEFPLVVLIENKENLGFSRANNRAIRIAKGDYILLLNPDTVIAPKSLDLMVDFMKKNQRVGALGPELIGVDGGVQPSAGKADTVFTIFLRFCLPRILTRKIKEILVKNTFRNFRKLLGSQVDSYFSLADIEAPVEIDLISGACFLINKEIIKEIGLLDERFFLYSEDADLCVRIRKKGWKVIYFPKVKVIHYGGTTTGGEFKPFTLCYGAESAYYYFKKHYSKADSFIVRILLSFALAVRAPWFFYHHFIFQKQNKSTDLWKTYLSALAKIMAGKTL